MDIQTKDAAIVPVGDDNDPAGEFEVILSAPTKDRDGDTLLPGEWKQPLPDHITFDTDHGMSVGSTVGSGVPRIDEATGRLIVRGRFSTVARAQEVRTLVKEGHIKTTSVTFLNHKTDQKDANGKQRIERELLNGAFVAIPSNREAVVLSAKTGARNSTSDASHIQAIHDHAMALGATHGTSADAPSPAKDASALASLLGAFADSPTLPAPVTRALDALLVTLRSLDPPTAGNSAAGATPGKPAVKTPGTPGDTPPADDLDELTVRARGIAIHTLTELNMEG
jgi:hypothetical protein